MAEAAYIVAACRTAGGRRGSRLKDWHAADLAARVLDDVVARAKADPHLIEDVIMGCVSQAGEQSTNIARNAVLSSSLPESVPATSVDRQCGSSQQALHFAAQAIMSGTMDCVIAAGVESMTRVPMGAAVKPAYEAGFGLPYGKGMQQRYPKVQFSQFTGAEMMAKKYDLAKEVLDQFALESHQKAKQAVEKGWFKNEIVPVEITLEDDSKQMHEVDEGIRMDATLEGISGVKLLAEGGRLTAATSSQICDGASAVMVVSEAGLKALGVEPLARIHTLTVVGGDPVIMLEAPIEGTRRALEKAGKKIDDIDLFEVNEAFASVPVAWLQELGADRDRLNVHGGAIALGHPLGGSGTKLMATLVHALATHNKKWGLQTMCEGGGHPNVTCLVRL
jgi:acetyl-CoA C-acetyltransferase